MSRVYNKTVAVDKLADQASAIYKVEKVSDAEEVTVLDENGQTVKLRYFSYKILEVIKGEDAGSFQSKMVIKSPPKSGLNPIDNKSPRIGQKISIADRSPLDGDPPKGKSYYSYHLDAPADVEDKSALFFTSGGYNNLSVYFGVIGLGLVDVRQQSSLQKALGIRQLFDAVRNHNLESLKSAIAKHPAAINQVDSTWGTPLQFAARYGKKEEIDLLIASGASLSTLDSKGNGVLHNLVESKFMDNLPYIIKLSGNLSSKNADGLTPLHLAVQGNAPPQMFKMLLEAGADPNVKDGSGESAMDLAKRLANPEVLKALKK